MPERQHFNGINVTSGGNTTLSVDVVDEEARVQIDDIADFVGYLSYLDGVTYNVNGASPVLEQGRFWTKWKQTNGVRPVDSAGNYIKVDWTQDWEIGVAVLFRNEVTRTYYNFAYGLAVNSAYWADAPVLQVYSTYQESEPLRSFALRKGDTHQNDDYLMLCDTGFAEGVLPDTWYFVKASYDSTTKTFTIAATKDFETWATNTSTYADRTPSTTLTDYLGFGSDNLTGVGDPAQNLILDLANCYIKQNDIMIWGHFDGAFAGENHYVNPSMPWRPLNDGYSNFWLELTNDTLSPWLHFSAKNNDAVIDWGDGSGEQALTTLTPTHTYSKAGRYIVKIKGVTGIARQRNLPMDSQKLQTIIYVELNTDITTLSEYAFRYLTGLKQVKIPNTLQTCLQCIFQSCASLQDIDMSNCAISNVPMYAFGYCFSLSKVVLPSTITSIQAYGFYLCSNLSEIHLPATTPPTLGASVFNNLPSTWICYVPVGYGDTYKAAEGWSAYADHILEEGQTPNRMMLAKLDNEADEPQDDMR